MILDRLVIQDQQVPRGLQVQQVILDHRVSLVLLERLVLQA